MNNFVRLKKTVSSKAISGKKVLSTLIPSVLVMTTVSTIAEAAGRPTFNFVQARYLNQDLGDFDCTQTGLEFSGSMVLNDQMFVDGSYSDVSGDGCASDFLRIGAGIRSDYGTRSSLFGTIQLLSLDTGADSDSGLGMKAGIRSFVDEGIEVIGAIGYDSIDEFEQSYISLGGAYWINPSFTVTGDVSYTDNSDTEFAIGLRLAY